ncbi:sulfite exporter TauE/SafE family protein [Pelagibacteraceae bacterium]|nr:sulfite exporter TauE/SafE family protein [Pelagibacteraceae bacterium]
MTSIVFIFLLTGLVSGFIAGLLGVGGGIIIVPVTYFILLNLGYGSEIVMHVAVASSLGVICFTSISSIRSHIKLKNTDLIIVKKWALGIVLGSIIGSYSASSISGKSLLLIFVILAFLISINMLFKKKPLILSSELPLSKLINFFISSAIGFLSSIIGIGGGTFSVPTLTMFSKKIHEAVGTSAVFGFLIAFPGTITFMYTGSNINELPIYSLGYVNVIIVFFISITSIFTAGIGAKVSSNIDKLILRRIFAIFLLLTCASLIIEHFII